MSNKEEKYIVIPPDYFNDLEYEIDIEPILKYLLLLNLIKDA